MECAEYLRAGEIEGRSFMRWCLRYTFEVLYGRAGSQSQKDSFLPSHCTYPIALTCFEGAVATIFAYTQLWHGIVPKPDQQLNPLGRYKHQLILR